MRKLIPSALIALIGVLPVATHAQTTPTPPVIQIEKTGGTYRTMAIGIGAIAGVVAFNVATGGLGTVPLLAALGESGAAAGTTAAVAEAGVLTANTVARSRVYAVASAVVGGWIGNWYATR